MGAKPGKRMKNGLPSLYFGHRHYKPRDWPGTNQPKNPVRAKYLLQALHEVYRRFSFNPVLMDALAGRSTQQDLQQPKICAIAYFLSIIRETPCDPKVQKNAEAESFLIHALLLTHDLGNDYATYEIARKFFEPTTSTEVVLNFDFES